MKWSHISLCWNQCDVLLLGQDLLTCEQWRARRSNVPASYLGDIYDGCVWRDFNSQSMCNFLEASLSHLLTLMWTGFNHFFILNILLVSCNLPCRTYLVTYGLRKRMLYWLETVDMLLNAASLPVSSFKALRALSTLEGKVSTNTEAVRTVGIYWLPLYDWRKGRRRGSDSSAQTPLAFTR